MARKRIQKAAEPCAIVNYEFEQRTYQIDPSLKKVYRRFVEIETSKAAEIFSSWRSQDATV
jgi:hypothetical protein